MNIYDFDKTIYNGDSSIDFFKYSLKKHKCLILLLPKICIAFVLYKCKFISKASFKSTFFSIVKKMKNLDDDVESFWKINKKKIKKFYLNQKRNDDIIISASPQFLLEPICKELDVKLIASNFDKRTGLLIGNNCYGNEKVNRLKEIGIENCDEFYSDSKSDTPMKCIAKKAFMVRKEIVEEWK